MSAQAQSTTYFDSVNFTVLCVRNSMFEKRLVEFDLNPTKCCLLMKCADLGDREVRLKDIASMLHLKPNVVTQAVGELEARSLLRRTISQTDARARGTALADAAPAFLTKLDATLYRGMSALFNPAGVDPSEVDFLLVGLRIGGKIGGYWSPQLIERYPSTTNLVSITLFLRDVERELKQATGRSLSECRILQWLNEAGEPQRIGDFAKHLRISKVVASRSCTQLEQAGLVRRLYSSLDRKATYLEATSEGKDAQRALLEVLNRAGRERYWGQLSPEDYAATLKIRDLFVVASDSQREKEHQRLLASLEPGRPEDGQHPR